MQVIVEHVGWTRGNWYGVRPATGASLASMCIFLLFFLLSLNFCLVFGDYSLISLCWLLFRRCASFSRNNVSRLSYHRTFNCFRSLGFQWLLLDERRFNFYLCWRLILLELLLLDFLLLNLCHLIFWCRGFFLFDIRRLLYLRLRSLFFLSCRFERLCDGIIRKRLRFIKLNDGSLFDYCWRFGLSR